MYILSNKEYHELLRKADAGEVAMLDNASYDTASDDMKSFLRRLKTHSDWYYNYIR